MNIKEFIAKRFKKTPTPFSEQDLSSFLSEESGRRAEEILRAKYAAEIEELAQKLVARFEEDLAAIKEE